jgi:hypothetical protein
VLLIVRLPIAIIFGLGSVTVSISGATRSTDLAMAAVKPAAQVQWHELGGPNARCLESLHSCPVHSVAYAFYW